MYTLAAATKIYLTKTTLITLFSNIDKDYSAIDNTKKATKKRKKKQKHSAQQVSNNDNLNTTINKFVLLRWNS